MEAKRPQDETEQRTMEQLLQWTEGGLFDPQPLQPAFHRDDAEDEPWEERKSQSLCQDTSSARCQRWETQQLLVEA